MNGLISKYVAPLVGAWIEIYEIIFVSQNEHVAPLVGAWIEMSLPALMRRWSMSLPSWERGLKFSTIVINPP